jgi:hypothetical protein
VLPRRPDCPDRLDRPAAPGYDATVTLPAPTVDDLRATARIFNGFATVDRGWLAFVAATAPGVDLSAPQHRAHLLRWLNSWGCRIRYPRDGEPAVFDDSVAGWWREHAPALPSASLYMLSDPEIDALGTAYAALAGAAVAPGRAARTLGPTAAAKALYALRPAAVMPWDAAIAVRLHGARDGAAFARHLRLGRRWAASVLAEAAVDEDALPALVGRPGVSLAKLLDEYCYVSITMAAPA